MMASGAALALSGCAPRLYTTDDPTDSDGVDASGAWTAPSNGWPTATPPSDLAPEGLSVGQTALDIRGTDARGDEVSLWQFYGSTVLVDISTMWCSPCQELGVGSEAVYQAYKDLGFVYLTVLHENIENEPPSSEDLALWATLPASAPDAEHPYTEITAPIIADPEGESGSIQAVQANQYPVLLLIGPTMKVEQRIEPAIESRVIEVLDGWFEAL
jgi:thiol-disulfide isomerase/thioredoxin